MRNVIAKPLLVMAAVLLLSVARPVSAITKVAQTEVEPGAPFTLIDTSDRRLVDGSVALLTLMGATTQIELRTHKPYDTAIGHLPADMVGGTYDVSVLRPDGVIVPFGSFHVLGPAPQNPSITPTSGAPGTSFTITDPLGRAELGDIVLFYPIGMPPMLGNEVTDAVIAVDGKTITGTLPVILTAGDYGVTVRANPASPSRFPDLRFLVT